MCDTIARTMPALAIYYRGQMNLPRSQVLAELLKNDEDILMMFKSRKLLQVGDNLAESMIRRQVAPKRLEGAGVEINYDIACTFIDLCMSHQRRGTLLDIRLLMSSVEDYWREIVNVLSTDFNEKIEIVYNK